VPSFRHDQPARHYPKTDSPSGPNHPALRRVIRYLGLTDLKAEVLKSAGAASTDLESPPRRYLQYPCRLLPGHPKRGGFLRLGLAFRGAALVFRTRSPQARKPEWTTGWWRAEGGAVRSRRL